MGKSQNIQDELGKLIKNGTALYLDMLKEHGQISEDKIKETNIEPISFRSNYQQRYSEAREVVSQLLPNRLEDFESIHKPKSNRKNADYETYTITDYLINLKRTYGDQTIVESSAGIPKFQQQLFILKSAQKVFVSSLLNIKQILQADMFDSEIQVAQHLNKNGFARAAGAISGVIIESHLQQICASHNIKIVKKRPTINDLAQLLKDSSVIDHPEWRRIQYMSDIRNLCDHKGHNDPTKEQINDLLVGTDKLIKTVF